MTIKVSDLIYVLDTKSHTVVPCKIVEKVTSVSLTGEDVFHMAETPAGKSFKLENCKNPWFTSIDDARNFLKDAAENLILETIQKAQQIATEKFGDESLVVDQTESNGGDSLSEQGFLDEIENVGEKVQIDLGNGQIANVQLPNEIINEKNLTS